MNTTIVENKKPPMGQFLNDKNYGSTIMLTTLKNTFGFSAFRPYQEEIVSNILAGKDMFQLR